MLDDFHFLRPLWLLAIPVLVSVAWIWLRKTQRGSGWEGTIDDALLHVLLDVGPQRTGRWLATGIMAALLVACLGMAGPTWHKLPQTVEQRNDALVIVLDLSLSMLAEDVQPSRMERARQKVADTLRLREEGQTGLVAYAGDAHAVVPLTDDNATIENLLGSLSPEMMPVFGSNPDHALQLAHELFSNGSQLQGRILLITDGIDDINSVSRHRDAAFPISIIGVGTVTGAPIPLDRLRQPGRVLQTQEGNQVVALLDEQRLRDVADLTYGRYAQLQVGDADINLVLDTPLPGEDDSVEVEREFDTWFDRGYLVTLVLIPLVLALFRKGVLVCVAVILLLPAAPPAHAAGLGDTWEGLWQRGDQRGVEKLRHGEPEKAVTLFDDPDWRAAAQYRAGDYQRALQQFESADNPTAYYNQGNALARLGNYEAALERYDQALQLDPSFEDAAFNKALVEQAQEEKQQAQQDGEQQDQGDNEQGDSQQGESTDPQQAESDQEGDEQESQEQQETEDAQEEDGQPGEPEQTEEEQQQAMARNEKQDALEQWLRRVPDDPGGLLRRKFSHETKQRLRRGEYENRQGDKLW